MLGAPQGDADRTVLTPSASPASPASAASAASSAAWLSSATSLDSGFPPGTILLGRYRVVGLLGKGGMGEVYRADDLVLGQAVALKFLPQELVGDADRMARFHHEVRVARTVSHPNVCRVYDIGALDGRPFLSMELVDGEDLSSLLRRIGRLPRDKVVELGRQICAGLAAAHNVGVLHRDLKPANIMIDGRGKVRITDFGLAVLAEQDGRERHAGTPAYMSPEQLSGQPVQVRSDVYSLGLVMFEMATGRRPYQAASLDDLTRLQRTPPPSPSSLVEEIDPALERTILHCLELDPEARPSSAMAVALSLPGGDPLAAALEAGETPSPELVAAAGAEGRMQRARGWFLLVFGAACVAGLVPLSVSRFLVPQVGLPKPPAVLADRAEEIVLRFGYKDRPADRSWEFEQNKPYLDHVTESDKSPTRWNRLPRGEPPAVLFWYRQSPRWLRTLRSATNWSVSLEDPPPTLSGMVSVVLDPSGKLVQFDAVPPQRDSTGVTGEFDPIALFTESGLDPQRFVPAAPRWVPPVYADTRLAWVGTYSDATAETLRVEAGLYAGRPVHFDLIGPWNEKARMQAAAPPRSERVTGFVATVLFLALIFGSVWVARRNLRQGRGDRRGAWRVALLAFAAFLFTWALFSDHAPSLGEEWEFLVPALGVTLFYSALVWVLYVALEPPVRRRWPHSIISWTRLLAGRLRDPLVARDVLLGVSLGAACTYLDLIPHYLLPLLGHAPPVPEIFPAFLRGPLHTSAALLLLLTDSVVEPMATLLLLIGMRALRIPTAVAVGFIVLLIGGLVGWSRSGGTPALDIPLGWLSCGLLMFVLLRFGLLATIAFEFTHQALGVLPLTVRFDTWYASSGVLALLMFAFLLIWGFLGSRARRPAVRWSPSVA
jgi:eukaryotic-like serine/threonine-protein kinase